MTFDTIGTTVWYEPNLPFHGKKSTTLREDFTLDLVSNQLVKRHSLTGAANVSDVPYPDDVIDIWYDKNIFILDEETGMMKVWGSAAHLLLWLVQWGFAFRLSNSTQVDLNITMYIDHAIDDHQTGSDFIRLFNFDRKYNLLISQISFSYEF